MNGRYMNGNKPKENGLGMGRRKTERLHNGEKIYKSRTRMRVD